MPRVDVVHREGQCQQSAASADILTYLLEQPHELIAQVVQWLSLKDLLNLRATSRRLHQLVHTHGPAIAARYARRLRHHHPGLQLPATLRGLPNDLLSYIELQYRYEDIHQLSLQLSHHVCTHLRLKSPFPTREGECLWLARKTLHLHGQLFPWLFALNCFLESLRKEFIENDRHFASLSDEAYLCLKDVYDLDQQHIIEAVYAWSGQSIVNITAALQIFVRIAAANGLTLKSRSPKYPFASVKRILIFRGLMPFKDILCRNRRHDALNRTKKLVDASERLLDDGRARPFVDLAHLLPSIHHLDDTGRLDATTAPAAQSSRCVSVRNGFVDSQDLWVKAASAVARRKRLPQSFPPNTNEWLRRAMQEKGDPPFNLSGAWTKFVGDQP